MSVETPTTSTTETTVRGFKYLYATDKDGVYTTDPKKVVKIVSHFDRSTEWQDRQWLKVPNDGPIKPCGNGFHMSATPRDARVFVRGNVLALVEARGDFVDHGDKSAHREMRMLAWWPEDAVSALNYSDQSPAVPTDVENAAYQVKADAQGARRKAHNAASSTLSQATAPAERKYEDAARPHSQTRALARKLIDISYDEQAEVARAQRSSEREIADARRNAAYATADAQYNAVVNTAATLREAERQDTDSTYNTATAAFKAERDAVTEPANDAYHKTVREANDAYEQAVSEANATVNTAINEARKGMAGPLSTKLGKPAAGSIA